MATSRHGRKILNSVPITHRKKYTATNYGATRSPPFYGKFNVSSGSQYTGFNGNKEPEINNINKASPKGFLKNLVSRSFSFLVSNQFINGFKKGSVVRNVVSALPHKFETISTSPHNKKNLSTSIRPKSSSSSIKGSEKSLYSSRSSISCEVLPTIETIKTNMPHPKNRSYKNVILSKSLSNLQDIELSKEKSELYHVKTNNKSSLKRGALTDEILRRNFEKILGINEDLKKKEILLSMVDKKKGNHQDVPSTSQTTSKNFKFEHCNKIPKNKSKPQNRENQIKGFDEQGAENKHKIYKTPKNQNEKLYGRPKSRTNLMDKNQLKSERKRDREKKTSLSNSDKIKSDLSGNNDISHRSNLEPNSLNHNQYFNKNFAENVVQLSNPLQEITNEKIGNRTRTSLTFDQSSMSSNPFVNDPNIEDSTNIRKVQSESSSSRTNKKKNRVKSNAQLESKHYVQENQSKLSSKEPVNKIGIITSASQTETSNMKKKNSTNIKKNKNSYANVLEKSDKMKKNILQGKLKNNIQENNIALPFLLQKQEDSGEILSSYYSSAHNKPYFIYENNPRRASTQKISNEYIKKSKGKDARNFIINPNFTDYFKYRRSDIENKSMKNNKTNSSDTENQNISLQTKKLYEKSHFYDTYRKSKDINKNRSAGRSVTRSAVVGYGNYINKGWVRDTFENYTGLKPESEPLLLKTRYDLMRRFERDLNKEHFLNSSNLNQTGKTAYSFTKNTDWNSRDRNEKYGNYMKLFDMAFKNSSALLKNHDYSNLKEKIILKKEQLEGEDKFSQRNHTENKAISDYKAKLKTQRLPEYKRYFRRIKNHGTQNYDEKIISDNQNNQTLSYFNYFQGELRKNLLTDYNLNFTKHQNANEKFQPNFYDYSELFGNKNKLEPSKLTSKLKNTKKDFKIEDHTVMNRFANRVKYEVNKRGHHEQYQESFFSNDPFNVEIPKYQYINVLQPSSKKYLKDTLFKVKKERIKADPLNKHAFYHTERPLFADGSLYKLMKDYMVADPTKKQVFNDPDKLQSSDNLKPKHIKNYDVNIKNSVSNNNNDDFNDDDSNNSNNNITAIDEDDDYDDDDDEDEENNEKTNSSDEANNSLQIKQDTPITSDLIEKLLDDNPNISENNISKTDSSKEYKKNSVKEKQLFSNQTNLEQLIKNRKNNKNIINTVTNEDLNRAYNYSKYENNNVVLEGHNVPEITNQHWCEDINGITLSHPVLTNSS